MLHKHAHGIADYLQGKYDTGLLELFLWSFFNTYATMDIRTTKIVFHEIILPELERFRAEYRLTMKTTYYRYDPLAEALDVAGLFDSEILYVSIKFQDA